MAYIAPKDYATDPEVAEKIMRLMAGELDVSWIALSGQVWGRIEEVKPVEKVIRETTEEFFAIIGELASRYLPAADDVG